MTLDELRDKLEDQPWYWTMMRPYWTIKNKFSDLKWELKTAYQRAYRGYDDTWHWEIHSVHTDQMIASLTWLKNNHHGCPGNLYNDKEKDSNKVCLPWKKVIQVMIDGFLAAKKIDDMDYMTYKKGSTEEFDMKESKKKEKELRRKFDKGMKMFHLHYFSLWD